MYDRPRNLYQVIPIAASVPKIVATKEDVIATKKLFQSDAHRSPELKINFSYQTNEKFVKFESFDSLNE